MKSPSFVSPLLKIFQNQQVSADTTLKAGQVLSGEVKQLYPGQRALLQLGTMKITAQLEAALKLNQQYWFQVVTAGRKVHMKVLPGRPDQAAYAGGSMEQLLSILGWNPNKDRIRLFHALFKQGMPYRQKQLQKALQLYDKAADKRESHRVLVEIAGRGLPFTDVIYEAIKLKHTTTFTEQLAAFASDPRPTAAGRALENRLAAFGAGQTGDFMEVFTQRVISEADQEIPSLFQLLQRIKVIPASIAFSAWQEAWHQWRQTKGSKVIPLPYQLTENATEITERLVQLGQKQLPVSVALREKFVQWFTLLQKLTEANLTDMEMRQLTTLEKQLIDQGMINKLTRLLTTDQQQLLNDWISNTNRSLPNASLLARMLQPFADVQLTRTEEKALVDLLTKVSLPSVRLKEQFVLALKHMVFFSGLYKEISPGQRDNHKREDLEQHPLKSLLFLNEQAAEGKEAKKASVFLQFLTGMQLTAYQESEHFIHTTLQLPAAKWGVKQDVVIDFEGRKKDTGEINPDFCNILFYLEFDNLGETVVSMRIQKRIIQLTIFNDTAELDQLIPMLEPSLKLGLQKLDYELAAVQRKTVNTEAGDDHSLSNTSPIFNKGVDYRA